MDHYTCRCTHNGLNQHYLSLAERQPRLWRVVWECSQSRSSSVCLKALENSSSFLGWASPLDNWLKAYIIWNFIIWKSNEFLPYNTRWTHTKCFAFDSLFRSCKNFCYFCFTSLPKQDLWHCLNLWEPKLWVKARVLVLCSLFSGSVSRLVECLSLAISLKFNSIHLKRYLIYKILISLNSHLVWRIANSLQLLYISRSYIYWNKIIIYCFSIQKYYSFRSNLR